MTKQYANRDAMALDDAGGYYCRHVSAMTGEGLYAKSDIAAELGYRDMVIDQLKKAISDGAINLHFPLDSTPEQILQDHNVIEAALEERLARIRESRREWINRHNLNKGK